MTQCVSAIVRDKRGRVLSVGRNSYTKTHPIQAKAAQEVGEPYKIFLHAEIDALVRLRNPTKAASIHVYRYDKAGNPVKAAPCKICQRVLQEWNLQVFHT